MEGVAAGPAASSFVGRARELRKVGHLLDHSRLVTLVGTGGAGKTRLALEAGSRFEGRVYFCDLAALNHGSHVSPAVGAALGFPPELQITLAAAVGERFGPSPLLVVLDNCEHVRSAAAVVAQELVDAAPRLKVLATSRERLHLTSESVWPVSGLSEPEAMALLADRVTAHDPGFAVTGHNRAALTEICARLEGLPLALELVAPRLALLPAEQVAALLDDGLGLDETMRRTLEWSANLLSPASRRDLWRLGVFAATFRLDAAAAVLQLSVVESVDRLAALRDASLLVAQTSGTVARFRLLEPIRQFALAHLVSEPDEQEMRRLHAAYVVADSEWIGHRLLGGAQQAAALQLFEEMLPDLRQTVSWASEAEPSWPGRVLALTGWAWEIHARILEFEALSRIALGTSTGVDRARLLVRMVSIAARRGDPRRQQLADATVAAARAAGDTREYGFALAFASLARPMAEASVLLDELASLADEHCDQLLAGWQRFFRGNAHAINGDLRGAQAAMAEAVAIFKQLGDPWLTIQSQLNLIGFCLRQGEYALARTHLREVLREVTNNPRLIALPIVIDYASTLGAATGRPREAAQLRAAQARIRAELGMRAAVTPEWAERAARAGVAGPREQEALVAAGARMSSAAALALAQQVVEAPLARPARQLSRRELEIAQMVARGMSNKEIAESLHLSVRTVEGHVENVLGKLDLRSRAQVASWAAARELI